MFGWRFKLIAIVVLALCIFYAWPLKPPPEFPVRQVTSLNVELRTFDQNGVISRTFESNDIERTRKLLQVMQAGTGADDHKCGDTGTVLFQNAGGPPLKFGILAGHDPGYYEYRYYSSVDRPYDLFKVDRQLFLAAMAELGVTDLDLGGPE